MMRASIGAILMLALQFGTPDVRAAANDAEIEYLLSRIASSNCEFNRYGVWYDAKRAQEHLRYKYDYLVAHHAISSTEDFIEMAASRSSYTGRDYLIRCPGSPEARSNRWMLDQLAQFRASQLKPGAVP
jgi:hypothetical protein